MLIMDRKAQQAATTLSQAITDNLDDEQIKTYIDNAEQIEIDEKDANKKNKLLMLMLEHNRSEDIVIYLLKKTRFSLQLAIEAGLDKRSNRQYRNILTYLIDNAEIKDFETEKDKYFSVVACAIKHEADVLTRIFPLLRKARDLGKKVWHNKTVETAWREGLVQWRDVDEKGRLANENLYNKPVTDFLGVELLLSKAPQDLRDGFELLSWQGHVLDKYVGSLGGNVLPEDTAEEFRASSQNLGWLGNSEQEPCLKTDAGLLHMAVHFGVRRPMMEELLKYIGAGIHFAGEQSHVDKAHRTALILAVQKEEVLLAGLLANQMGRLSCFVQDKELKQTAQQLTAQKVANGERTKVGFRLWELLNKFLYYKTSCDCRRDWLYYTYLDRGGKFETVKGKGNEEYICLSAAALKEAEVQPSADRGWPAVTAVSDSVKRLYKTGKVPISLKV